MLPMRKCAPCLAGKESFYPPRFYTSSSNSISASSAARRYAQYAWMSSGWFDEKGMIIGNYIYSPIEQGNGYTCGFVKLNFTPRKVRALALTSFLYAIQ